MLEDLNIYDDEFSEIDILSDHYLENDLKWYANKLDIYFTENMRDGRKEQIIDGIPKRINFIESLIRKYENNL